jgi:hypothetical protein
LHHKCAEQEPNALSRTKKLKEPITDPTESAKAAGLRYVSDTQPGIYRKRQGKGFRYVDPDGNPMRDKETLGRIKSLVIPPGLERRMDLPKSKGAFASYRARREGKKAEPVSSALARSTGRDQI